MVEPISTPPGRPRILRPGEDAAVTLPPPAGGHKTNADVGAPAPGGDTVSLSDAAQTLPAELRQGPPVDTEAVKRIKEAIAENRYPIDIKAITEALFQDYMELVS